MEQDDNSVNEANTSESSFKTGDENTQTCVSFILPPPNIDLARFSPEKSSEIIQNSGDEDNTREIVHTPVEDSESSDEPPEKIPKITEKSITKLPAKKKTSRKSKTPSKRKLHISHPYPMEYYYPCEKRGEGAPNNQKLCDSLRKQQRYSFKHLPREKRGFDAAIYNRHLEKIEWGDLFVFGQGDSGQLGLGPDVLEASEPTFVKFDVPTVFKEVVSGGLHTVVLSHLGDVYSCGCNDEGALGRPSPGDSEYIFEQIKFPKSVSIQKIVAGDSFSAALSTEGVVYAWGTFRDSNGPIGLKEPYLIEHKPVVAFNRPDFAVSINAGNNHLVILTSSGKIFTCGCAENGQLGRLSKRLASTRGGRFGLKLLLTPTIVYLCGGPTPKELESKKHSSRVFGISTSKCGSFAFLLDGRIFTWGLNNFQQLHHILNEHIYFPMSMEGVLYKIYEPGKSMGYDIAGGVEHTVFVDYNNKPLTMGDCRDGRLGRVPCDYNNCSHDKSRPLPIHLASTHKDPIGFKSSGAMQFHTVACGDACTLVITGKGELYSWGVGCNLQLGIGGGKDLYEATHVDVKSLKDQEVLYTSSGAQHSAIIARPRRVDSKDDS